MNTKWRKGLLALTAFIFAYPKHTLASENASSFFTEPAEEPISYQVLRVTRAFEAGVTDRILLDGSERFRLSPNFSLDAQVGLSAFDLWGLSLVGFKGVGHLVNARSDLFLSLTHERWPAWQVSENRVLLGLDFHPYHFVRAIFGMGYRAPIFQSTSLSQALSWSSSSPELQVVYRFEWTFLEGTLNSKQAGIALWIYDLDQNRLWTPANIHFALAPELELKPGLRLTATLGTALKGLSGGVVSWAEDTLAVGVRHDL